jgi:hypothetical protein
LVGGLLLAIGLFTRPVAFILAGDMAVAYFMAHAPKNFFPLLNGGDASTAALSSPVPGLVESEILPSRPELKRKHRTGSSDYGTFRFIFWVGNRTQPGWLFHRSPEPGFKPASL